MGKISPELMKKALKRDQMKESIGAGSCWWYGGSNPLVYIAQGVKNLYVWATDGCGYMGTYR
jgi:hypothetical protein